MSNTSPNTLWLILAALAPVLVVGGCGAVSAAEATPLPPLSDGPSEAPDSSGDGIARPEGWHADSHSDGVEPSYDVLFPSGIVGRLELTITAADWRVMLDDMTQLLGPFGQRPAGPASPGGGGMPPATSDRNPIFVPCTLRFNGRTWLHVGVRFKGLSSLRMTWQRGIYKLPLRLDMDQFEDQHPEIEDQRLYGFKKLGLSNGFNDPSLIREQVTGDLLREAGVPAARTAFYRIYLDHGEGLRYMGLYTMTEIPDDPMLQSQLGATGGNLYKPEGPGADWTRFDQQGFAKKSNEEQADYSDVEAAIAALHADRQDAAAWRSGLEAVFDVDGFVRWLAVNTLLENWDVYGNIAHNYFLYAAPADAGRVHWIPWDHNHALQDSERNLSLQLSEVGDRFPLIRYLMDDPVYQAAYYGHLRAALDGIYAVAPLQDRLRQAHALVAPHVVGDEGEQPGYSLLLEPDAFPAAIDDLTARVDRRHQQALQVLAAEDL